MSDPHSDEFVQELIGKLREREVPPGAKARVFSAVQARAANPGWSLARLSKGTFIGGVTLLVGGAAVAGLQISHGLSGESSAVVPTSNSAPKRTSGAERRTDRADLHQDAEPLKPQRAEIEADHSREKSPMIAGDRERQGEAKRQPRVVDTALAEQVRAYKAAIAESDPARRVVALSAFKRKFSTSPLLHEVDLQLVAALGAAQSPEQQKAAASQFLSAHPESARAQDVQKLIDEGGSQ